MSIKHYLSVYSEFLRTNVAQATSFRTHFVLLIVVDIVFYLATFASVSFIYDHVALIGDWNRAQFMFFIAFILAVDHLHMTCVSENFWSFSETLIKGTFDFVLLKPIGSLFSTFFRHIRVASAFNFILPWSFLLHYSLELGFSPLKISILPFLVVFAVILLTSIEILLSTATFFLLEAYGINFLRMNLQRVARWPDFIFQYKIRKFFTIVVPILLVASGPVRFLFQFRDFELLLGALASLGVIWVLIRIFWSMGIRHYESASS